MVWLTSNGIAYARKAAGERNPELANKDLKAVVAAKIPAIVSRQTGSRQGEWQVGFSSHLRRNGSRLRVAAAVLEKDIVKNATPFDVCCRLCRDDSKEALVVRELVSIGRSAGLEVGLYGSLALQTLTGFPYMTTDSDYDIYIRPNGKRADAAAFYQQLCQLEQHCQVIIDCEIECGGYGVKLEELVSKSVTVLGKGLSDVVLLKADSYREFYHIAGRCEKK